MIRISLIAVLFLVFAAKASDDQMTSVMEAIEEPAPQIVVQKEPMVQTNSFETIETKKNAKSAPRKVVITSGTSDYDRKEGVIMFAKNVFVDDVEYKLHADRIFVFLDGTNELKRIVADGNVAMTNDSRVGTCAKATYNRSTSKVVLYGDGRSVLARLEDNGSRKSVVTGRKITFWTDAEQVEVEGSTIEVDATGAGGADAAKKLLKGGK